MTAGNNKRAAMDWFDRKVLQYVLFWGPAGGMDDEDVFPEFGMRVDQLNAVQLDHLDAERVQQPHRRHRS